MRRAEAQPAQPWRGALLASATLFGALLLVPGCGRDCEGEVEAASEFLTDSRNLACQVDEDCVVVHTGCAAIPGAFCGQVSVNRTAAESERWQDLSTELESCDDDGEQCALCAAQLIPSCQNGSCGRAE